MENDMQNCQLSPLLVDGNDGRRRALLLVNNREEDGLNEQREETCFEDSISETTEDHEMPLSDSECDSSDTSKRKFEFSIGNELVRLVDGDKNHNIIKEKFMLGMGSHRKHSTVVAVHRNSFSSSSGQAKLQSFRIFSEAMTKKCSSSSNANIKFAWYGTSCEGLQRIIYHGFGLGGTPENNGLYGSGIYLSPENSSIDSAISSIIDKNGLRHLLLCRVILGNVEEVLPGSEQFHPSSEEFDSGVDNLLFPKTYIVWSTHMNTHILPEYVISFRAPPCLKEFQRIQEPVRKPTSPWMPFPTLISVLSRFLPPPTIGLIKKHHSDYREKRITRQHLIQRVRQIAGDKLLIAVIKSCRAKDQTRGTRLFAIDFSLVLSAMDFENPTVVIGFSKFTAESRVQKASNSWFDTEQQPQIAWRTGIFSGQLGLFALLVNHRHTSG